MFYHSFVISLWCLGLSVAAEKDMVLHGLKLRLLHWGGKRKREAIAIWQAELEKAVRDGNDEDMVEASYRLEELSGLVTFREWLVKPVLTCPACMSSLHGTGWLVYNALSGNRPVSFVDGLFSIVISVFLTRFTWAVYLKLKTELP